MPPWAPTKRRELIRGPRQFGFTGPFSGGNHQFMTREDVVLTIPNPHRNDIGVGLLSVILRQAGISRKPWERA